jgi:hypothetical protein
VTRAWLVLFAGLALSLIGTLTATDAISLREVVYGVPVLSSAVFGIRGAMGTSLAHAVEPACAVLGASVMLLALRLSGARRVLALQPRRA